MKTAKVNQQNQIHFRRIILKRKIFNVLFALVLALSLGLVMAVPVSADVGITTADADVNADTFVTGLYTELPAIVIAESAAAEIATITIVLDAPGGFEFRTTLNPDVVVTGGGGLVATFTSISTTQLTINVATASSSSPDTLTIGGTIPIGVRPTTGTLTTDDITMSAGTITGVTIGTTPFGTLTMVVGAVTQLAFDTQPAGSVSGSALTTQPVVEAQDQFGNTDTAYVTDVIASEDDAGTLTGTLTVTPIAGVATFTDLVYTATADAETFEIDVASGALTPATSSTVTSKLGVTVTPASGGGTISSDDESGVWTTLGSIVITEGAFGDIAASTFVLTIPTGFEFQPSPVPDVVVTGSGELVATSPLVITGSTIAVTITVASSSDTNVLTIGGGGVPIKVKPTAGGTPLTTGDILMTSGTIEGVTATTNFGTLTMVVGTVTQLVFTTQPAGSISGSPLTDQPVVEAQDVQGNTDAAYVTPIVASEDDPGDLTGTLTAIPVAGVATFTDLVYTATANAETFEIYVTDGTLNVTSSTITSYIEVTLTTASGGTAISADTYATGAYTELGPIIITEAALGTIATVTIVLDAPGGFEFRTTLDPDVAVTGTGGLAATFGSISTTQLTINVGTASSSSPDTLTIGGINPIGVRPAAGTLATGDILMTAGTIEGLSGSTNFGTLTMVVGAVTQLVFDTQPAGSVSGFDLTTQPVVEAQDQFGNTDAAYVTNVVASEDDLGTLTGTLTVTPIAGVATFDDLVYTATVDGETFQIDVASGALTPATSTSVNSNVVATKILVTTAPASIENIVSMTQPVVAYVDAQNTVDTGITSSDTITITEDGTGSITAGSTTVTASSGVVAFSGLVYTGTGGEAVTFTFTDNTGGAQDFSLDAVVSVVTVYDVILTLSEGWTLFSTDNWIDAASSTWIDTYVQFLKYTPTGFLSANLTDDLKPVEALYAQMGSDGGDLGIIYSTGMQGISTKELVAGWNLVSSATLDDADVVFSPLRYALIGGQQGVSLTTVVAQGTYNLYGTVFNLSALTDDHWGVPGLQSETLDPFEGFWVHMNAATSFSVIPD
ncbi:hypothetical protein LCGC14_0262390 [marine sediment metagenome]|uniref:Uncharacterized protein n=1 Tax=marine sediment metagenome TaxID=412755 RepID=A0A0F9U156_9ZZZZ